MNHWITQVKKRKIREMYETEANKRLELHGDKFNLSAIKDESHRATVAILLENQRLMNSSFSKYRNIDLQIVRDVYGEKFRVPQWVNFSAMLGPAGYMAGSTEEWCTRTRRMKTRPEIHEDEVHRLKTSEELSDEIRLEIEQEVFMDIRNNSGTVSEFDYHEELWTKELCNCMSKAKEHILLKSKQRASVLIIPEHLMGLFPYTHDLIRYSIDAPDQNCLVIAAKSDPDIPMGYFYGAYVPLTKICNGLMTRYSKKLTQNGGANLFARIDIKNVPKKGEA